MAWNNNCVYAPDKFPAKHCKKTNTGKRQELGKGKRKTSGVIGKGYFCCSAKCSFFKPKSGLPANYVMNEALA